MAALVRAAARVGDLLGAGPLRTTAIGRKLHGNADDPPSTCMRSRRMAEALRARPATVQDLWHARSYPRSDGRGLPRYTTDL